MVAAVLTRMMRAVWAFSRVAARSIVPMFRGWAGPSEDDAEGYDDEYYDEDEHDEAERQTEAASDDKQQVPSGFAAQGRAAAAAPASEQACTVLCTGCCDVRKCDTLLALTGPACWVIVVGDHLLCKHGSRP
jgi:hypothetical protein